MKCEHCNRDDFKSQRALDTHVGIKHKNVSMRLPVTDEKLLNELVSINKKDDEEFEGSFAYFNGRRAVDTVREIRATLSGLYGIDDSSIQQALAVETGYHMETIRATAQADYRQQIQIYNRSVDSRILAAQKLAEDTIQEGDVFAAVVSPIELGMDSRVWVSGADAGAVKEINGLLTSWNVIEAINAAWQDMETYSAFYVQHKWKDRVPTPVHLSPKRVCVGPDTGFGPLGFYFLPPAALGDNLQTKIEFGTATSGTEWNEWLEGITNKPLNQDELSWIHFLKPKHKMYPYPWLAKAATPVYTRQIIEEMRLALVQGLINQLWLMTVETPQPGELTKLKSVIAANRAERVGFLLWRAGIKVELFHPDSIEQLLLPEAWWGATLDIFRRMGRTVRIISGEPAQRAGQGSGDAEVDVRIAQNKAMGHRQIVARKIVLDLIRQYGKQDKSRTLNAGEFGVHMTPVQLFLGEDLQKIWGPMWNYGMASVQTIHAGIGLDTDVETETLKQEKEKGYEDVYQARQQFAQRVATPGGEVTKSPEPGRPEGQFAKPEAKAALEDTEDRLLAAYDTIDQSDDQEERRKRVLAFIALLTTLLRAHMREAYEQGYAAVFGTRTPSAQGINESIAWEQQYIDGFQEALLVLVDGNMTVAGERYRVVQHVQASWRRAFMDGVFQAKEEDGWRYWQRVLRPSKSGPCDICKEDAKRWHPITEPFWDHPYGVCSSQVVRFMRTGTDGWDSYDRQMIPVPTMDWEE